MRPWRRRVGERGMDCVWSEQALGDVGITVISNASSVALRSNASGVLLTLCTCASSCDARGCRRRCTCIHSKCGASAACHGAHTDACGPLFNL